MKSFFKISGLLALLWALPYCSTQEGRTATPILYVSAAEILLAEDEVESPEKIKGAFAWSGGAYLEVASGQMPPILERIAFCESGNNHLAKNPNSSASGTFQFIDSTWKSTMRKMGLPENSDVFDEELNYKAAKFLFAEQGVGPWLASRECWSRKSLN